ncbi:carbonic anhydrase [Marivirga sericea]|uniref:Carbonic anhydrase n=1 Tax=Marivirga sericea TaxID=1028 RepID=A0A1X7JIH9_9BACT|nr:carbonic anhydrase [Marivirga sericea]SMG27560.1 carbonic anhydrase [Marivirga sericea]
MEQQSYSRLFENNKKWVEEKLNLDPHYFENHAKGQKPKYLYIGCSDSRLPVNEMTGTSAGELFIHRNVANMVVHTDNNLMSVLQYAIQVLKVEHVVVCGHYGCGGVAAAIENKSLGLIDSWLMNIKESYQKNRAFVDKAESKEQKVNRLVESNVKEQVYNLFKTSYVQEGIRTQGLQIHGWVYDLKEGLLKDLNVKIDKDFDEKSVYDFH